MMYSWTELTIYLVVYAFFGWLAEAFYHSLARRRFSNRGLLSMPLILSYGVTFDVLLVLLPTMDSWALQYLTTLVVAGVVESLTGFWKARLTPKVEWTTPEERLFAGSWRGFLLSLLIAGCYYLTYLVVQPLLMAGLLLVPDLLELVIAITALVLIALDLVVAVLALRGDKPGDYLRQREDNGWRKLADRVTAGVWRRLDRAYPGIQDCPREEVYTFAKGLCLDKLIWVFLVSALVGDLVEMLYCGLFDGAWMSRSSVLYGPFSFVWGLGGLLFTVSLQRLAGKHDRYVFLGGFVIGGVFECACSVFTELVFGTVFWDYSHMPLNIGGRTNVLFCFFWGALAVVWVKVIYPPMSAMIERLPAVAGKALTWVILLFMLCNAALTVAAMARFDSRSVRPESANPFEAFLDRQYDDDFMTHRWPNMKVVEKGEEG